MAGLIQAGVKQLPKNSKDRQDEVEVWDAVERSEASIQNEEASKGAFWMGTWRVRASGNQEWLDTGTLACTAGAREGGHTKQALRNRRVHGRQQWSP